MSATGGCRRCSRTAKLARRGAQKRQERAMSDDARPARLVSATPKSPRTRATALLLGLALADFAAHMLVSDNYGYFRDELYYIEAGRHLSFGYVDFPPLIAWLARFLDLLAGDALWAIHVVLALATALIVLLTGLMARELGGGSFAQVLAAFGSLVVVTFLATGSIFSMDALDELWWALAAYVVILILKRDGGRLWLQFGLIAGLGLTTKVSMLFFGLALVVGLLLTPARRHFRAKWIWLGGAIAFAFLVPYVLWNAGNGWPTLEFFANYEGSDGPLEFLIGQILGMNPLTLPLSLAGIWFYLGTQDGRPYRALGWAFVVLLFIFTLLGAKAYFLSPAYPMLFAGGAVVVERLGGRVGRLLIKPVYVVLLLLSGLLLAPLAMPILPPATFANSYGFMWDTMTRTVAGVYDDLPAAELSRVCIFTANYGEASALNFLGDRYGLPPAISGHNSYYLWGPGACTGEVMITVGLSRGEVERGYAVVERATGNTCRYCVLEEENGAPVYVAANPKAPISDLWPRTKHYE